ncbi:MAG: hypothetical protein ACE15F_24785 [bacterium]
MLIAAIHILRLGSYLEGQYYHLYYGYFSDFVLPVGGYFLLCAAAERTPILRRWPAKPGIAFLVPALAETGQYFGISILGATFDPLDYLMYGMGVLSAWYCDARVFPRIFDFG